MKRRAFFAAVAAVPAAASGASLLDDIRFVGEMEKIALGPEDIFVVHCNCPISNETAIRIRDYVSAALGHKVLVLSGEMKLGVLQAP